MAFAELERKQSINQFNNRFFSSIFEILDAADRDLILQHLLALGAFDRRLRFCSALPDSAIADYVARIDFARDLVLGYREQGKLIALVHLGALRKAGETELGISVVDGCRGRGLGVRLTGEAFRLAREHGFTHVHVYFMDENLPMRGIVGHYPVPVRREGGDNEVCIPLELAA
jgi:ribosomal protein S18 acetylase RimI-like enzyme